MTACRLNPREQHVLAHATYFVAYQFLGRGNVVKVSKPTRDEAIDAARVLTQTGDGRGALVYAVAGVSDAVVDQINAG